MRSMTGDDFIKFLMWNYITLAWHTVGLGWARDSVNWCGIYLCGMVGKVESQYIIITLRFADLRVGFGTVRRINFTTQFKSLGFWLFDFRCCCFFFGFLFLISFKDVQSGFIAYLNFVKFRSFFPLFFWHIIWIYYLHKVKFNRWLKVNTSLLKISQKTKCSRFVCLFVFL